MTAETAPAQSMYPASSDPGDPAEAATVGWRALEIPDDRTLYIRCDIQQTDVALGHSVISLPLNPPLAIITLFISKY